MNLEQENQLLKQKLAHAQDWMQREIHEKNVSESRNRIEEKVYSFFPSEMLSYFPSGGIENIISAELVYEHLILGEKIDGMSVILSYCKIIDSMVELYVTKGFRKSTLKIAAQIPHENYPLEKSLRLVIEKKYTLSLGRLYQLISNISQNNKLSPLASEFSHYLKSRPNLEKSLLSESFLLQLQYLIESHIITDKRHSGILSTQDTKRARECIIGNLENTNCILYTLGSSLIL